MKTIDLSVIWRARLTLQAEGATLQAKGATLWAEAVLNTHGNIEMTWHDRAHKRDSACELNTGEVFEP